MMHVFNSKVVRLAQEVKLYRGYRLLTVLSAIPAVQEASMGIGFTVLLTATESQPVPTGERHGDEGLKDAATTHHRHHAGPSLWAETTGSGSG